MDPRLGRRFAVTLSTFLFLATAPTIAAQQTRAQRAAADQIAQVAETLENARSRQLDLISPRRFEEAEDLIERAWLDLDDEDRLDEIADRLEEAEAKLDEAERNATTGRVLMGDALEARRIALDGGARDYSATLWNEAERKARDAGRRVETNEINEARDRAAEAAEAYRAATADAVGSDVLGAARLLADEARAADADRYAPRSLVVADSLLESAERLVALGSNDGEARADADRAGAAYARAIRISLFADSVRRNDISTEDLVLRYEALLEDLAEGLAMEPDFASGPEPVKEQIAAAIGSLVEDRERLEASVIGWSAEVDRLERVVDDLDARLAELEEREASASAELREARRRDQKVVEARAIFSPGEAEVLVTDNQLLVRLVGLTFSSGSAEIAPAHYSLLTKVQAVIREFPYAAIAVEGHTDSTGNDDANLRMSQNRADAVRDYLLQNSTLSTDRITAQGFGESRPIASNNSEDGRERNRRIDVRISPID